MKVECTNNKIFRLTDNEHLLGELAYKNLFSHKAEITLTNSEHYNIKSAGFFGTSIVITRNDTEIAKLKMNWKGQIVMSFQDGHEFVFKGKGVFHNKYVIENKEEEELVRFDPKFNWGTFNYNYEISYVKDPRDILFVLIGVYAANYYISTVAASA